ncbi:MAG: hypothetical protein ACI9ON_000549, partial [Limisphaerales bacterium]
GDVMGSRLDTQNYVGVRCTPTAHSWGLGNHCH